MLALQERLRVLASAAAVNSTEWAQSMSPVVGREPLEENKEDLERPFMPFRACCPTPSPTFCRQLEEGAGGGGGEPCLNRWAKKGNYLLRYHNSYQGGLRAPFKRGGWGGGGSPGGEDC